MLQSPTIQLRAPELADLDFMFHVENDTRLWLVSACKVPYSRYQLQQYIETNTHDLYADKQLRLMIEHRASGAVVGMVDLFDFSPADHRAEVGIVIDAPYRRMGLAVQSLHLLTSYARSMLGLHQLYAYVSVDNQAARALFTRCGYTEVAVLPQWLLSEGRYKDVCIYQYLCEK